MTCNIFLISVFGVSNFVKQQIAKMKESKKKKEFSACWCGPVSMWMCMCVCVCGWVSAEEGNSVVCSLSILALSADRLNGTNKTKAAMNEKRTRGMNMKKKSTTKYSHIREISAKTEKTDKSLCQWRWRRRRWRQFYSVGACTFDGRHVSYAKCARFSKLKFVWLKFDSMIRWYSLALQSVGYLEPALDCNASSFRIVALP